MPIHDHDCPHCKYLGTDTPAPGEPRCNVVDMYICTQGREDPEDFTLIRRYSSEPSDYACAHLGYYSPKYQRLVTKARELGHVTHHPTTTSANIRNYQRR